MKGRSDDPSHHERTFLPGSYISLGPPWRVDPTTHRTMNERSYHGATSQWVHHEGSIRRPIAPWTNVLTTELHLNGSTMKGRSDDPSHHERTFLPRSYISMGPPWRVDPTTHRTMNERSYHGATSQWVHHEGRSDDPSHHERTFLPRSYISMGPPWRVDPTTHRTMNECSYQGATSQWVHHEGSIRRPIAPWTNVLTRELHLNGSTMKGRSDDPSHHERTFLPGSYISMGPPWRVDPTTHRTMNERSYHGATSQWVHHEGSIRRPIAPWTNVLTTELHLNGSTMKGRSDDPSHHERMFLPGSYISMGPPWRVDPTTHRTMNERSYQGATSQWVHHEGSIRRPIAPWTNVLTRELHLNGSTMKGRSDDPSHHERTFLPGSYISMGPPWRVDPTTHRTMNERSYQGATSQWVLQNAQSTYHVSCYTSYGTLAGTRKIWSTVGNRSHDLSLPISIQFN